MSAIATPIVIAKPRKPPRRTGTSKLRFIQDFVAFRYEISRGELLGERRQWRVSKPRHIAVYLCYRLTDFSLPRVGRHFSDRDHTTILNSVRRVEQWMQNPLFAAEIEALKAEISEALR